MLREMFPGAKFVHIHRNPYEVFVSMRNFYRKLLAEFALQDYAHVDIDEAILSVYVEMMTRLERESEGLGAPEYIEMRYQDLDAAPMAALERIYSELNLQGFSEAKPHFEAYLASVRSFEKNKFAYSDEAAALVEGRWGHFLEKWNYKRP